MGLVTAKLEMTAAHMVAMSILVLNLFNRKTENYAAENAKEGLPIWSFYQSHIGNKVIIKYDNENVILHKIPHIE